MLISGLGASPSIATVNDLMLPRARATASAVFLLIMSFIGQALGPYFAGYISDTIMASGVSGAEALRQSMLWSLLAPLAGLALLLVALRSVETDEASLLERARGLGEHV